jgi:hypothetical protein
MANLLWSISNKMAAKKKNKYKAIKSTYNGQVFHSKKEKDYAVKLDLLKKSFKEGDRVLEYKTQVKFPIKINDLLICTYILDFIVTYADGRIEYVDIKGYKKGVAYSMFRVKKKLTEAIYKIQILEK